MKLVNKIEKLFFFFIIKLFGKISPAKVTEWSYLFYKKHGMKFEKGKPNYIASTVYFDGGDYSRISIGAGVTISSHVSFLTHDWALNTVIRSMDITLDYTLGRHLPIIIHDNVFIGRSSIIMPGATIGEGSIIGAGSVVRGNIPPFSVVVGNPGIIVKDSREYVKKYL